MADRGKNRVAQATTVTITMTSEKKQKQRADAAQAKAGAALFEEVHRTNHAIDTAVAGNPNGLAVAKEHGGTAQTLADQIHGGPRVAEEKRWAGLVARQVSLDKETRQLANAESTKPDLQIAKLSTDLDDKSRRSEEVR